MSRPQAIIPVIRLAMFILFAAKLVTGAPTVSAGNSICRDDGSTPIADVSPIVEYNWNMNEKDAPLISFADDGIRSGFEQSLAFRIDQFSFPIFQVLEHDEGRSIYLMPSLNPDHVSTHLIELTPTDTGKVYASTDGSNLRLIDQDTLKTLSTSDGAKYSFVQYPDGEFRCATIKDSSGAAINLLYAANGLVLHGIVDNAGRRVTFNYEAAGITSVTQTWMANSEGITKTWAVGNPSKTLAAQIKYSHVTALKALPADALVRQYTSEMAESDRFLAQVFGGPKAVAGGNGFEPAGLAATYPLYRGDVKGDDGRDRPGHLSYAIHLYGSPDGTGDSPLYVPAGFTANSGPPSPTDAVVTFYYPKLGNVTDVTLAVFHVANFHISYEDGRVRIGNLGGPGGSSPLYKHSHIEIYRGNTGLPPAKARAALRLRPSRAFAPEN